ncbi:hypothetical protein FU659_33280 [Paenibacillus sp. N3.4]|nr:hypothetical protein FU659_33280 [Paenibacillus sp. N3.4]
MSKKKSDKQKPLAKGMAAVLSATIAATSVVSVLPAQVVNADEVAAIAAVNAATNVSEMQAALNREDLALNLTGYISLSSVGKDVVAQKLVNYPNKNVNFASQPAIQTALNTEVSARQNEEILQKAISAVNSSTGVNDMRTALEDPALGLILTTYNNLSTPDGKQAAAQMVLDYRRGIGSFASQSAIQNQFNIAVQNVLDAEALATAVNNVNTATDAASMSIALEDAYLGLVLTSFNNLNAASQDWVALQMFTFKQSGAFANKAAIQTKLNAYVSQRAQYEAYAAAVLAVNNATTAANIQSAFESSDLGLNLTEYYKLTAAHKNAAAQALLNYKNANGGLFADQPSIQTALDTVVHTEQVAQAVDVVNAAADVNSIKSALTSTKLGLTLTTFNGLVLADKNAVANLVLTSRGGGFADKAAVQTALDSAISTNAPMAAVNGATDVSSAEAVLGSGALGLVQGVYANWKQADKTAVAAAVIGARPVDGYVNLAAVQVAFDNAITARTPVAAVNSAANATAIQAALENVTLTLNLGAYTTWKTEDNKAVSAAVFTARTSAGFADLTAIQNAFNTALTNRTAIAAVNIALDVPAMQTALENATLTLGAYATWMAADKAAVSAAVLTALPTGGYVDKVAVQAAFDTALGLRTKLAQVNIASDAAAMQIALDIVGLGLNKGASYDSWLSADKAAVSAALLAVRPSNNGFANIAALQSAFDTAVNNVAPMANINGAGNAGDMQDALEDEDLDLTLSLAYTSLSPSNQTTVAGWVLNNRPTSGYVDKLAVQAAMDMAVALEYVNIAPNAATMQTALGDTTLNLTQGAAYPNWTAADKTAVAASVLSARSTGYADKAGVQAAFDAAVTVRTPVANVNVAANTAATQTALESTDLNLIKGAYAGWTTADKTAVATLVHAGVGTGYADKAAVQGAFNAAILTRTPVANVNVATDTATTQLALEDATLSLALGTYTGWKAADKTAVAATVHAGVGAGYADKATLQTAFNAAVALRSAVAAVNSAADAAATQTALEAGALNLTQGVYANWTAADKTAVATLVHAGVSTGYADKAAVQTAFDAAVALRTAVANVNTALNAAATQAALESATLNLTQGVYAGWTAADKTAVAAAVHAGVGSGYADKPAVQAAFNAAITARTAVAKVNVAANAAAMRSALEDGSLDLDLTDYNQLHETDKILVADHVRNHRPQTGFVDEDAIQVALDSAISEDAPMAAVNNADGATKMQTALENVALGLDLVLYNSWSAADKAAVSEDVLANLPDDGYINQAAVQAAFGAALVARTPVANVNVATEAATQAALEAGGLNLNLGTVYLSWTTADKTAVAAAVHAGVGAGYADKVAVQAAFNVAVTERTPVADVNVAANAAAMQVSLEDASLDLDLSAYDTLSAADKLLVADHVLNQRPTTGFVDQTAIQLALENAIAEDAPMAAVNNAINATAMETALEEVALGLTLGVYNGWSNADKAAVSAGVYANRPGTGYVNQAAVQAAFDAAVTLRTPVANVNVAVDAAATQAALEANALNLTLGTIYLSWTAADKTAVAVAVHTGVGAGYADKTAVQTAFNLAVTARTPVANVNVAANAAATRSALEAIQLGIDLSVYNTLGNVDKQETSNKVFVARPGTGFVNAAEIQAALDHALEAGALNRDTAALEIGFITGDAASHVTDKLTLPLLGVEGSTISWSTDIQDVVAADGTVTRPAYLAGDATVTLTATLTKDGVTKTKEFVVKVIKKAITDSESVAADKAALGIVYTGADVAARVTQNLTLPTVGTYGTTITWVSNNSAVEVNAATGKVTRPLKTASNEVVTLTATITINGVQSTKVFEVNVLKETSFNNIESVAIDKAALDIVYSGSDKAVSVTQNLTLPTTGTNGTDIIWVSSDSTVITGMVK